MQIWTILTFIIFLGCGYYIGVNLRRNVSCPKNNVLPSVKPAPTYENLPSEKRLLFVGVMTAAKFLDTRAATVYKTWGQTIPGKVAFFSSETSVTSFDIPVVALKGVTDTYPPQKKSFMMLKFMYDNYIDKFEWFMRADDDVYIRGDKMETFLRSINSSKPLFMGQSGLGKKEELGKLGLAADENFCMGGPGMIFSRETLRRMAPHIQHCLTHLYSFHEDVEIGRCVRQFANVSCTWTYEMLNILHHNTSDKAHEKESYIGNLYLPDVVQATTLHPFKVTPHMFRAHAFFYALQTRELRFKTLQLMREVRDMNMLLKENDRSVSHAMGLRPELNKSPTDHVKDLISWDFISRSIFSEKDPNPKRGLEVQLKLVLEDIIMQFMFGINKVSRERGRVIDFKEILYGYHRHNPLHGSDWILDILMTYKKYQGRKMTVPVRKHAYLQQTFTKIEFMEETGSDEKAGKMKSSTPKSKVLQLLEDNIGWNNVDSESSVSFVSHSYGNKVASKIVHFILPLAGRFKVFQRFMQNFEKVCLKTDDPVKLVVILFFHSTDDKTDETIKLVKNLGAKYSNHDLKVVQAKGPFSRALALEIGARYYPNNALLFFVDVDMYFTQAFVQRVRLNTIQHRQVYYPIVFSQFDPVTVYGNAELSVPSNYLDVTRDSGYWRQFGYGIASLYNSDLRLVGGMDTGIIGWGKEDVDLFNKFVNSNITIFRAPDPGIVHVFHTIDCDPALEQAQLEMCRGTRASTYGSTWVVAEQLYANSKLLNSELSAKTEPPER